MEDDNSSSRRKTPRADLLCPEKATADVSKPLQPQYLGGGHQNTLVVPLGPLETDYNGPGEAELRRSHTRPCSARLSDGQPRAHPRLYEHNGIARVRKTFQSLNFYTHIFPEFEKTAARAVVDISLPRFLRKPNLWPVFYQLISSRLSSVSNHLPTTNTRIYFLCINSYLLARLINSGALGGHVLGILFLWVQYGAGSYHFASRRLGGRRGKI